MANGNERREGGQRVLARWLLVAGYVGLIFFLSAQPGLKIPGTWEYRDKIAHTTEYCGLGILVWNAALATWPQASPRRRALLVLFAVSALAACDEKFQSFIPGRDSDVYDWMADTLGGSLAQIWGLSRPPRRGAA